MISKVIIKELELLDLDTWRDHFQMWKQMSLNTVPDVVCVRGDVLAIVGQQTRPYGAHVVSVG